MNSKIIKSLQIMVVNFLMLFITTTGISIAPEYVPYVDPDGDIVEVEVELTEREKLMSQMVKDYEKIKDINNEIAGWIYLPEMTYGPVMYSGDNEKYLRTTYKMKKDKAGEMFLSKASNGSFDDISLIYGHNMANGSKFGLLRTLRSASVFKELNEVIIYDGYKEEFKIYNLYSYFKHIDGSILFEKKGIEGDDRYDFFESIQNKSHTVPDYKIDYDKDMLFLQTCTTNSVTLNRDVAVYNLKDVIKLQEVLGEGY